MNFILLVFALISLVCSSIELYPNFNTIGITVVDSALSCSTVEYCQVSPEICGESGPLVKAPQRTNTHYGSLFNLKSSTEYSVSVTCGSSTFEASVTTREDYSIPTTFSQTLYVSPDGSGTDCTSGTPCSVSTAVGQLTSGTKVVVKTGVYKEGGFYLSTSGTSSEPIVFEGEVGAVFDGSSDVLTMTSQGSGIYTTDISSYPDAKQVVMIKKSDSSIQRLLQYFTSETNFNNLIYDTLGFWISGNTLKVNIDDLNIDDYDIRISVQSVGFEIYSDYIYFSQLEFKHYGYGSYAKAIYLYGSSYGYITNCLFNHNDMSIGLKQTTDDILIENNDFYDSKFQFSWQGVKDNDQDQEMGAITTYQHSEMGARGIVVRYNTFHDYFDGFGVCQEPDGGETLSNEIDIHNNYVYNIGDDALECDGLGANVRIWNNKIENTLVGISLAPTVVGPAFVFNNQIIKTGKGYRSGDEYYGMGFKFNVDSSYTSGILHIYHNYVDTQNPGSSAHVIYEGKWENIILRNNILIGDEYSVLVGYSGMPMDFDYDGLYCRRANELVYWESVGDNHFYPLSEVQTEVGQEEDGIQLSTDDIFISSDDPFNLKSDSGLIGVGQFIPGLNREGQVNIGLLKECDFFVLGECTDDDDDDESNNVSDGDDGAKNSIFPVFMFFLLLI